MDEDFIENFEAIKRDNTPQLLMKCGRLVNEYALSTLPPTTPAVRAAHTSLFPHIDFEGTRPSELARRVGISKQAAGQLVDDLVTLGVVARVPDPSDGRAKLVVFTDRGKKRMLQGMQHLGRVEEELRAAVGGDVMDALQAALLALHDHLVER